MMMMMMMTMQMTILNIVHLNWKIHDIAEDHSEGYHLMDIVPLWSCRGFGSLTNACASRGHWMKANDVVNFMLTLRVHPGHIGMGEMMRVITGEGLDRLRTLMQRFCRKLMSGPKFQNFQHIPKKTSHLFSFPYLLRTFAYSFIYPN